MSILPASRPSRATPSRPIWQRSLKRTGKQRSEWWFRCEQGCDLPPARSGFCNERRCQRLSGTPQVVIVVGVAASQALIAQQEQQALNAGKRGGQVLFTFEADS
jgi:hypothetical protein